MNTPKERFENRLNNNKPQKKAIIINELKYSLNIIREKFKQIEISATSADSLMLAVAMIVLVLSCSIVDEEPTPKEKISTQTSVQLEDICNISFILMKNEDGTETAEYKQNVENEKTYVTFKNDGKGNITYLSGNETLLPLIAMNYLYYRGYNPVGSYNSTTHTFKNKKPIISKGNRYWKNANTSDGMTTILQ